MVLVKQTNKQRDLPTYKPQISEEKMADLFFVFPFLFSRIEVVDGEFEDRIQ